MRTAREEILERIRGLRPRDSQPVTRQYCRAGGLSTAEMLARFHERVADYGAEVSTVTEQTLAAEIGGCLVRHCARRVGIPPELPTSWRPAGIEFTVDRGLNTGEIDRLDAALTGCTVAVAETGTIVLAGGPTDGRRALTLIPDIHVCVVLASQIVASLPEAFAVLEPVVAEERRPLTLISGPSATSDIELSRVEGVHGPRTLAVFVVNGPVAKAG